MIAACAAFGTLSSAFATAGIDRSSRSQVLPGTSPIFAILATIGASCGVGGFAFSRSESSAK